MAARVRKSLEESGNTEDKFLVIAGSGHIDYRYQLSGKNAWKITDKHIFGCPAALYPLMSALKREEPNIIDF